MAISKKVAERIVGGHKKLIPVVLQQKTRDVSEADTVFLWSFRLFRGRKERRTPVCAAFEQEKTSADQ
jgi:hypothetical protein